MSLSDRAKALGMDRPITRRDFLNGVALTVAGAAATTLMPGIAHAIMPVPYPPALTGLRGHSPKAMEIMHAVRDGTFWDTAPKPENSGEHYDLVVVGGGISGLAAAVLWRQQQPDAKILILENNDDFGGHARRNEFTASNGKKLIGYGGSESLQTPSYFSPLVKQLLVDIGIKTEKFSDYYDQSWSEDRDLGESVFFRKEVFGTDTLVKTTELAADWVRQTPLNDTAKTNLVELIDSPPDYLPGKSRQEKFEILSKTTYADFLTKTCGYDSQLIAYFQASTGAYFGVGVEATTALDAWGNGNPGFDGMDLGEVPYKTMSPSGRLVLTDPDDYIYHFPDGNAGVVRALVRALIPDAVPGTTMEDLVTAQVNYGVLDSPENTTRLRLNASVVRVAHDGPPSDATNVILTYVENGGLKTVTGANVVLACWHRVIPHITSELPPAQVEALNDQVKVPLIYTNVQLKNWQAFAKLGIDSFECPSGFWDGANIDMPVTMGDYAFADKPDDPVLLHISKVVVTPDPSMGARDQATAGRYALMDLTFEQMEFEIRDMLDRALKAGGFDAATDIEAITCNRWSHGYALEYMRPWDQFWPDGPLPIEASRKGWGRIAIANSDAGAYAYAHSAMDQAARAVSELLGDKAKLAEFSKFPGPPLDMIGL
ncbi:spermidine dehydrogenase [Devosia sp. UYZn731]|uniref:NAD(P)-binding protein n=1 Tax=Devosia sp. UYZn731 TaxID=3156345 RepID=UPI0033924F5D